MAEQRRINKVAEKIRAILSTELFRISDPRFRLVTLTSVVVSQDLRMAKVYWTVTGGKERSDEVTEALEEVAGVLRKSVGGQLGTRFVPHLKFFYDDTMDTMEEVERLFQKIHAQENLKK